MNLKQMFSEKGPAFWWTGFAALISSGTIFILFISLVIESIPVFKAQGISFLWGADWFAGEAYGALPMIFGSLMVTGIAVVMVLPFALGSAILTSEFLSGRLRLMVKAAMELLAGVPGIIYGLMGIALLTVWVRDVFGLIDGNTLFTAGVLLAVMILPTVMTLSEDALRSVPGEFRDTALSLGLTRMEMVLKVVVPQALPGLAGAVFLHRPYPATLVQPVRAGTKHPFQNRTRGRRGARVRCSMERSHRVGIGVVCDGDDANLGR
jgi:phosphate transport system permease protein